MEGENSLEMAGVLYSRESPWGLGGMEGRGGVGAHGARWGCRRGCVRTEGLVKTDCLMTDREVDARRVAEEVWFWDKSLKGETEDNV